MEPQDTERNLVEQADQVVASFCVCHFMKQHSVQFLPVEQLMDAGRKHYAWGKDAIDSGHRVSAVEAHRYAICREAGRHVMTAGRVVKLAMLSAQTRDQSQE